MKIELVAVAATSSAPLTVGQRVAVEYNDDEWHFAVIQKLDGDRVTLKYDTGDIEKDKVSGGHIHPVDPKTPKSTKQYTTKQIQKFLTKVSAPAPAPSPTPAKKNDDLEKPKDGAGTKEDQKAITRFGNEKYWQAADDVAGIRKYLGFVFHMVNKGVFGGQLEMPRFRWLKNMGVNRARQRGHYNPSDHVIALSPMLFEVDDQEIALTTIVHELCHAAVYKIDKPARREPNQGHGPLWEAWMRKCGLTPSRFSVYDNSVFMDEDEKKAFDDHKEKLKVSDERLHPSDLRSGLGVKYPDPKTGAWVYCVLARPNDKQGKRWAVYQRGMPPGRFMNIPSTWFSRLKPEEQANVEDLQKRAEDLKRGLDNRDVNRAMQRRSKRDLTSLIRGW